MSGGEVSTGLLWHASANLVETDADGKVSWTCAQGIIRALARQRF